MELLKGKLLRGNTKRNGKENIEGKYLRRGIKTLGIIQKTRRNVMKTRWKY